VQHCDSFTKGQKHCDLSRFDEEWEVKICKRSGLTINQSKVIRGENYIVVNYRPDSTVRAIWVLWRAEDRFFSARKANSNARTFDGNAAGDRVEAIYPATLDGTKAASSAGEAVERQKRTRSRAAGTPTGRPTDS
jgi:hypothetical protein